MYEQEFKESLQHSNYYYTKERAELFRIIASLQHPASISDIVHLVSSKVDESTVYRNIEVFEKIGAIVRVYSGWRFKIELSGKYRAHHHHMTCTSCGNIIEFKDIGKLEKDLLRLASVVNFQVRQHTIELTGLCSNCHSHMSTSA